MDPASFAFSVVSMVELCIRLGKDLWARCEAYRKAECELQEANLRVQGHWIKIEQQLSALQAVWEALPDPLQDHQCQVLQILQSKLEIAIGKLESLSVRSTEEIAIERQTATRGARILSKLSRTQRIEYAAYAKGSLQHIVEELERWQRDFDPSWFFLSRLAVQLIDQKFDDRRAAESKAVSTVVNLRQAHQVNECSGGETFASIFLTADFHISCREKIVLSSAWTGHTDEGLVVIDRVPFKTQNDFGRRTKDVRDLARVLSTVDPKFFGLLSCRGVLRTDNAFNLILPIPLSYQQAHLLSLRSILPTDARISYPLNERVNLAASLARSVVFLHSSSFVHKSIAPENIIICQTDPTLLGTPFLVGFDQFRLAEGRTYRTGDNAWEKNIYRHPGRQGIRPDEEYMMQHDIYSIGVCLLEIGLWTSFVQYPGDMSKAVPEPSLSIDEFIQETDQRRAAAHIKEMLINLARTKLPLHMGTIYAEVVESCLTCLDKNNTTFGPETEFLDDDGIIVGVRYIEKVLFELQRIVV
ncbi:uncharacterized protein BO97DRAFT_412093 [Aspergillus homomorphus CBS 101889]|uniref:Protein kinase domain-containing protein n=1 Tax=Aspergillus homomorphus (strain CBS 101889) TaxID=1450537 RepID=A0A395I4X5_ASPHC|nr:hypothetical protein BO97DRAFT_412093 [Aspergillus homomorphus CBS 101889]RAL14789.1 hypothetical protein BO97DRAFT_412093 [Aspergillus homomorphus CBS 101889]